MNSSPVRDRTSAFRPGRAVLLPYLFLLTLTTWFAGVIVHELGHAAAGLILGVPIRSITISPFGWGRVTFASQPGGTSAAEWGIIAASGVGASLLVGYGLLAFRKAWARGHPLVQPVAALTILWLIVANPSYLSLAAAGFGDGVGVARALGVSTSTMVIVSAALVVLGYGLGKDLVHLAFKPFHYLSRDDLTLVWAGWMASLLIFFAYQTVGTVLFGVG